MRIIKAEEITKSVAKLCIEANCCLNQDIRFAIENAVKTEESDIGRGILKKLLKNADIAKEKQMPICQDTGMAVFFIEIGDEVFVDGNIADAINDGVRIGYTDGYLRKSVVNDPFRRKNTNDNTPAVIYCDFVKGENLKITYIAKGFGSENKSALKMLAPSDGEAGVVDFVLETVEKAGANPCPPMIVGVGIGGTMDKAAWLSKKALSREIDVRNADDFYKNLEEKLLKKINCLGIGPQGLGGTTTALAVNIEVFPTHIAGLPVAVNIGCHATRDKTIVL